MTGVHLKTRYTKPDKNGKRHPRYLCYYRMGGRGFKDIYAGSFTSKAGQKARRDLIILELAAGRDPAVAIAALKTAHTPPAPKTGLDERWELFIQSRVDVAHKSIESYESARKRWVPILGADTDPETIAIRDVIDGIAELHDAGDGLAPNSIRNYANKLAQVLDFCDVEPNPVRSRKVKMPKNRKSAIEVPSTAAWFGIRARLSQRSKTAMRLIECCGLRVSECANLTWGNIDFTDERILIDTTKTDAGRRWLPVPRELLDEIGALLDDPAERPADMRVFGLKPQQIRYDLERACLKAEVGNYSPHEFRHRRSSLWYRLGIDPVTAKVWLGHTKASMGVDTYGHSIGAREDEWREFWLEVSDKAPVRHRDDS